MNVLFCISVMLLVPFYSITNHVSLPGTSLTRHQHSPDCLKVVLLLTCKKEHTHTTDCYEKTSILQCGQEAQKPQNNQAQQASSQSTDYGPQILSTFFQTVVPGFLGVVIGAEAQDNKIVAQSFGAMAQGVGTIIDLGTRAKKIDPHFSLQAVLHKPLMRIKRNRLKNI